MPAYSLPDHVLLREIRGETVLLDMDSGQYFGLDAVGTRMMTALLARPALESRTEWSPVSAVTVPPSRITRCSSESIATRPALRSRTHSRSGARTSWRPGQELALRFHSWRV